MLVGRVVNDTTIMTNAGVGYLVGCPRPLTNGTTVELLVTTVVREDAIILYGFIERNEQVLFEALTRVSGVGAATAMSVISDLGVDTAVRALKARDTKTLSRTKGMGVKTAEKLCAMITLPAQLLNVATAAEPAGVRSLANTLTSMGFSESEALDAARAGINDSNDLPNALRIALGVLRKDQP